MTDLFTLEELDRDGALQETASRIDAHSRAAFLRSAGLGIGAVAGAGALLAALPAVASATSSGDTAILNYALTLEYLESSFYAEAVKNGALSGETKVFATQAAADELAHVEALKGVLGTSAVAEPKFNFGTATTDQMTFQATAEEVEYLGVSAYLGQVPNIVSKAVLGAAGSILPVEAWHSAWIADIRRHGAKPYPAPSAFAAGKSMAEVLATVKKTGFIV